MRLGSPGQKVPTGDWWRNISVDLDVTREFEAVYLIKILGSQG